MCRERDKRWPSLLKLKIVNPFEHISILAILLHMLRDINCISCWTEPIETRVQRKHTAEESLFFSHYWVIEFKRLCGDNVVIIFTKHQVNNWTLHLSPSWPWQGPIVQARQQINTIQDMLRSFLSMAQTGSNCLTAEQHKREALHHLMFLKDMQR